MLSWICLLLVPGEIPTIEAPDFSKELQASAVTATVRIVNVDRKTQGSGVIIGANGPAVYILTAGHVVEKTERLEIHTYSAESYPKAKKVYETAQVIARLKDLNDLAIVRLSSTDQMPGSLRVCPPRLVPREKNFSALAVGCGGGNAPSCLIDRAEKKQVRRQPGGEIGFLWEGGKLPPSGRSGGPLLDKQGFVIGVCSGTNDDKGFYCHTEEVHNFLRRNGLKWLYEEKEK